MKTLNTTTALLLSAVLATATLAGCKDRSADSTGTTDSSAVPATPSTVTPSTTPAPAPAPATTPDTTTPPAMPTDPNAAPATPTTPPSSGTSGTTGTTGSGTGKDYQSPPPRKE